MVPPGQSPRPVAGKGAPAWSPVMRTRWSSPATLPPSPATLDEAMAALLRSDAEKHCY